MRSTSILKRVGTENTYKVTLHSHWSDIANVNNPLDVDFVKWYKTIDNDHYYISAVKGHEYVVIKD